MTPEARTAYRAFLAAIDAYRKASAYRAHLAPHRSYAQRFEMDERVNNAAAVLETARTQFEIAAGLREVRRAS